MSEITNAIRQLCEEKNLSYEVVLETIESALSAAYRKDFGSKNQNIKVIFYPETGDSEVYDVKAVVEDLPEDEVVVVEEEDERPKKSKKEDTSDLIVETKEGEMEKRRFNPKTEIQLQDARLLKEDAEIGEEIRVKLPTPEEYGRMAAQTAKQVIVQKIREAERNMVMREFKEREHEVVSGIVQRQEARLVLVDLGKSTGILPNEEQIPGEQYRPGARIKVYVKEVRDGVRGPEILLSRVSEEIVRKIFTNEIPEIANGLIELKAVAREAGFRSKVAVWAANESLDPIGSCVGQRGARIQTIISELGGEKVDIIEYNEDPAKYIAHALAPAKVADVQVYFENHKAVVTVNEDQQSLAIGRSGQNVRLAARLTGWNIDVVGKATPIVAKKLSEEASLDNSEEEFIQNNTEDTKIT